MRKNIQTIHALLPQTQCKACGFEGCLPYAEALVQGQAPIDRCPPGGVETMQQLGAALSIDSTPFLASATIQQKKPEKAVIQEAECIGCTKCIQACPVDAILGSAKLMHSIIETECTGCGLCVEPCPVDCIEMHPVATLVYDKETARLRHEAREIRILRDRQARKQHYQNKATISLKDTQEDIQAKQRYILEALHRVNTKYHE